MPGDLTEHLAFAQAFNCAWRCHGAPCDVTENLIKNRRPPGDVTEHLASLATSRTRHGGPLARAIAAGKPHPLFPQRLLVQKTWSVTFWTFLVVTILAFVAGVFAGRLLWSTALVETTAASCAGLLLEGPLCSAAS